MQIHGTHCRRSNRFPGKIWRRKSMRKRLNPSAGPSNQTSMVALLGTQRHLSVSRRLQLLDRLLARGIKFMFTSNSDNHGVRPRRWKAPCNTCTSQDLSVSDGSRETNRRRPEKADTWRNAKAPAGFFAELAQCILRKENYFQDYRTPSVFSIQTTFGFGWIALRRSWIEMAALPLCCR